MDSEKWQLIKTVFEKVVDMPPEERGRELIVLTESNAELRKEVESLLEFDSQKQVICTSSTPLEGNTSGAMVGPYRLNFPLAINEKTEVWQAVNESLREASSDRRVALKFFKDVSGDERRERRFRQEAAILARFEHPSIARYLEEGETDSGVPWFSTAYVEGLDLLTMAQRKNLGLDERLDLFDQVCAALEYSHRFLVIHRDVKPANIIVDDSGRTTLIDFGISKQIAPALVDPDKLTRTFERTLTPAYASPEQLRGEPVSAVTDVYSAGLVLYELIAGHHPYSDPVHEKERPLFDRILFEMPAPPSVVNGRSEEDLRGLDQVVMQSISKAPDQRQQSVSELRRQISDLQTGKSIPGRGSSTQSGSWVQRNPLLAVVASALLGGLLVFGGSTLFAPKSDVSRKVDFLEDVARGDVDFDTLAETDWISLSDATQLQLLELAIANSSFDHARTIADSLTSQQLQTSDRFSLARRWHELGYPKKALDCLALDPEEFAAQAKGDSDLQRQRRFFCKLLIETGRLSEARKTNDQGSKMSEADQFERELTESEIRVASMWLDDLKGMVDRSTDRLKTASINEENRYDFAMLNLGLFGTQEQLRKAILDFDDTPGKWYRSKLKIVLAKQLLENGETIEGQSLLQEVLDSFEAKAPCHPVAMNALVSAEQYHVMDIDFVQWWEDHRSEVSLGHVMGLELFTAVVKWRRKPAEDYQAIRPWLPELQRFEHALLKIAALRDVWRGALAEADAEGAKLIVRILLDSAKQNQDKNSLEYAEVLVISSILERAFDSADADDLQSRFAVVNKIIGDAIDSNGDKLSVAYLKAIDRSSVDALFGVPQDQPTQTAAEWIRGYLNHCGNPKADQLEMVAWYSENHAETNSQEVLRLVSAAKQFQDEGGWGEKADVNWSRITAAESACRTD